MAVLCFGLELATATSPSVLPILVDFDPSVRFCGELPDDVPLTWEVYEKGHEHYAETITCIPGDWLTGQGVDATTALTGYRNYHDKAALLEINGYKQTWPHTRMEKINLQIVLGSLPNLVFIEDYALSGVKSIRMEGDYPRLKEIRLALNAKESIFINGSFPALESIGRAMSPAKSTEVVMRDLHSLSQVDGAFPMSSDLVLSKGSIEFVGEVPKLAKMQECFVQHPDAVDDAGNAIGADVLKFTITSSLPSYVGCSDYSKISAGVLGPPGTVLLTKSLHAKGPNSYTAATCILPNAFAGVSEDVLLTPAVAPNLRSVSYNAFPASYTGALTFAGDFQSLVHLDVQAFKAATTSLPFP